MWNLDFCVIVWRTVIDLLLADDKEFNLLMFCKRDPLDSKVPDEYFTRIIIVCNEFSQVNYLQMMICTPWMQWSVTETLWEFRMFSIDFELIL